MKNKKQEECCCGCGEEEHSCGDDCESEEETKFAEKGNKITEEHCPKCRQKLVLSTKDGNTEVFICENCKFKIQKKK